MVFVVETNAGDDRRGHRREELQRATVWNLVADAVFAEHVAPHPIEPAVALDGVPAARPLPDPINAIHVTWPFLRCGSTPRCYCPRDRPRPLSIRSARRASPSRRDTLPPPRAAA